MDDFGGLKITCVLLLFDYFAEDFVQKFSFSHADIYILKKALAKYFRKLFVVAVGNEKNSAA